MKNFTFILLILFIQIGFYQNTQAQSFAKDTALINHLNTKAKSLYNSKPELTKKYGQEALELAKKINYQRGIAEAYINQSLIFKLKADYAGEMQILLDALKIFEQLNDQAALANIYREIGNLKLNFYKNELDKNAFEETFTYYFKARDIYKKLNNEQGEAKILKNIGNAYLNQKNYEAAINYYLDALKIQIKLTNQEEEANLYNNLGLVYYEQKNYTEAMNYHQKSLNIMLKINNIGRLAASYYNIGNIHLANEEWDKALDCANKSLEYALKSQNIQAKREAYWLLTQVYAQKKDFTEAYRYHIAFKAMVDSIYNVESVAKITQIQALYESENKEQQLKLLLKEKKLTLVWFYGGLGLFSIFLIALVLVIYYQSLTIRKNHKISEQKEILNQIQQTLHTTELENEKLKAQRLEEDLMYRNKELTTFALNFTQKNNMLEEIKREIKDVASNLDKTPKTRLNRLINQIDYSLKTEEDWEDFKMYFEKIHIGFFEKLKENCPSLTNNDLRMCALTRLNINTKEMADIMGISPESVRMARHRLRKKLNLATDDNLMDFILKF